MRISDWSSDVCSSDLVKAFAWLCRTQLEGGFAGFARVLQSGLADKLLRRRTRNAAHRAVMPSQRGHGFDAGRLALLHLAAGNIGELEQAVLAGDRKSTRLNSRH